MKQEVVLITGGSTGLGKVIAQCLAMKNYTIYCTSRKEEASDLENIHFIKMDITSDVEVREAVGQVIAREGHIDIVVNNAGITLAGPTLEFSADDFKKIIDTNVIGSFRVMKETFSSSLKPRLVINITSLNGFLSFPNFGLYSASKFAAEALGLALRYELGGATQVVNVAPGALLAESKKPLSHASARERIKLLGWLLPLTSMSMVAEKVSSLMDRKKVPNQILIGRDAHLIYFMQKFLPRSVLDRIIFFIWKKQQ